MKQDKGCKMMQDLGNTQYFRVETEPETGVKIILSTVYDALTEKGYNPINQIEVILCPGTLLILRVTKMREVLS